MKSFVRGAFVVVSLLSIIACGDDATVPPASSGAGGAGGAAGSKGGAAGGTIGGASGKASGGSAGQTIGGSAGATIGGSAGQTIGGSAGATIGGSAGATSGGAAGATSGGSAGATSGGAAGATSGGSAGTGMAGAGGGSGGATTGGAGGSGGSAGVGGVGACPTFAKGVSGGKVASNDLNEISGIAASRTTPGILWVHNDGDDAKLYALTATGAHRGAFALSTPSATDIEDIAVGPGPEDGKSYVYLADVGDNGSTRKSVQIYRFVEPAVSLQGPPADETITVDVLTITYPDGAHDAEAFVIDPVRKEGFIITKNGGDALVFRVPAVSFTNGATAIAEEVAKVSAGVVSSADFSPDGAFVIIKNDDSGKLWRRPTGGTIADAVATTPCPIEVRNENNGEALGWAADGSGYYTTSEELHQPVYFFARQ